jgi:ankyrin repeat protein
MRRRTGDAAAPHGDGDDPNEGKKPSLRKLLEYRADPNSLTFEDTGERRTLLCLVVEEAVQIRDFEKVDLLLDAQADPNRRSENGTFPLQLAVKHSNVDLTRKLLKRKADVNQQDAKLVSPLHTAVFQDDARVAQLLLLHRANVNAADQVGQSPVFFASSRGLASSLVEAEADLLHLNKRGQSALHLAAHSGCYDAVAQLVELEPMLDMLDLQDERGRTALHHAAAKGHQAVVSRLMDLGADARLKTSTGQTAMSLAGEKHMDCSYYIYTRVTGGNKSTWAEMAQNPMALTLAAIMGVAFFVNRKLLWEFSLDLAHLYWR